MVQEKKDELSTRVALLINWLYAGEHAIYQNSESEINLLKTIDIIRWSLNHALPKSEWLQFDIAFAEAEKILKEEKPQQQKEADYNDVLKMVEATLHAFVEYINK